MRLNTRTRRDTYQQAITACDRAHEAGDTAEAARIYDGPVKAAAARLPVKVRARIDDQTAQENQ